jgi:P27 family predicted phage terminase small subunit
MGKRGPAKTPTQKLDARGSWVAKTRKKEPPANPGHPECPKWLTGEAREQWDRMIADLEPRKLLSKSYRESLALFCEAWGEFVDLVGKIAKLVVVDAEYMSLVRLKNAAAERVNRMGQQFGYSPSAKAGVTQEDGTTKTDGKLRFFAG